MFVKIIQKKVVGPFLYKIFDGFSTHMVVSHEKEFNEGDFLFIETEKTTYNNRKQLKIKKSDSLDSAINSRMKDIKGMHEVAKTIITAMLEQKKIFLRHHADADGICGALALERVIPTRMRMQSRKPFYDDSVLRDMGLMNDALVILIDHGSTKESTFALEVLDKAGIEYCIIDHHRPVAQNTPKQINSEEYTAGMLAFEVAQIIHESDDFILPAIAGKGDKSDLRYYEEKTKKSSEELKEYALALDFMAFIGGKGYEKIIDNYELAKSLANEAERRINDFLDSAEIEEKKVGDLSIIRFNLSDMERGFPNAGKITGHLLSRYEKAFVMGVLEDHIIIRSNAGPAIAEIIGITGITGGGHARAGTIHFKPGESERVIKDIEKLF